MKQPRTWVLIADAGRARIVARESAGAPYRSIEGLSWENDIPPAHELVDDRQPRSFESVGAARHPIEPGPDPRRKEKARFAQVLAEALGQHHASGRFDRLVIVAPPQLLGDLRQALGAPLQAVLAGDIAKDLTKTPDHDLAAHIDAA